MKVLSIEEKEKLKLHRLEEEAKLKRYREETARIQAIVESRIYEEKWMAAYIDVNKKFEDTGG